MSISVLRSEFINLDFTNTSIPQDKANDNPPSKKEIKEAQTNTQCSSKTRDKVVLRGCFELEHESCTQNMNHA